MIARFEGHYAFLSNFHLWDVIYKGIVFPTAEHAFQASKAISIEDAHWVLLSPSPGIAKRRGKKIKLRKDWDDIKLKVMYEIILAKFNDPARRQMLINTAPATLIEGNYWCDQFWGNCMCTKHIHIPGKNYLGKLLMALRSQYITD